MSADNTQRGSAALEFALGVAALLLPVAVLVVTFPTWVERQSAARVAAQEAARAVVLATSLAEGQSAAAAAVHEVAANHGIPTNEVRLDVDGTLQRGSTITATVAVRIPAALVPGGRALASVTWRARHSERVDDYRSVP